MALKEFDGELDAPSFKPFDGSLDDDARQPLPDGVKESTAGAGRGLASVQLKGARDRQTIEAARAKAPPVQPFVGGDARAVEPTTDANVLNKPAAAQPVDMPLDQGYVDKMRADFGQVPEHLRLGVLQDMANSPGARGAAARHLLRSVQQENASFAANQNRTQDEQLAAQLLNAPRIRPPSGNGAASAQPVRFPDVTPTYGDVMDRTDGADIAARRGLAAGLQDERGADMRRDVAKQTKLNQRADAPRDFETQRTDLGHNLLGGAANLAGSTIQAFSPSSEFAKALNDVGKEHFDMLSDPEKAKQERMEQRLQGVDKNAILDQAGAYLQGIGADPSLALSEIAKQVTSFGALSAVGSAGRALGNGLVWAAEAASPSYAIARTIKDSVGIASRVPVATSIGAQATAGAAMGGGDAANQTFERLMDKAQTPDALFEANPDYQQLIKAGKSPAEARMAIAETRARLSAIVPAIVGAISGTTGLQAHSSVSTLGGRVRRAGAELGGEVGEESATQVSSNAAIRSIDPSQSLTEDVGRTIGQTLVGTAPMAGAAFFHGVEKPPGQEAPPLRPTERRKKIMDGFDDIVAEHGLPPNAAKAARETVDRTPLAEVPGFLKRFAKALAGKMGRQIDDAALGVLDDPQQAPPAPPAPPAPEAPRETPAPTLETQLEDKLASRLGITPETAPAPEPEIQLDPLDHAAHQAATSPTNDLPEPTPAQKEAGNYKNGHVRISGMDVSIENPMGSTRSSKDPNDPWSVDLPAHYGYIRGSTGSDGDHVDLFIGGKGDNGRFWVINQNHVEGGHDEHKVITGVDSAEEAVDLYKRSFADNFGDKVFSSVSAEFNADQIKQRLPAMRKPQPVTRPARGQSAEGREAPGVGAMVSAGQPAPSAQPEATNGPRVIANAGRTPNSTEPLTIHTNPDGTLTPHLGKQPLVDFETGEPIVVPAGTSDLDVKKAIRNAKALGNKINFYPPKGEAEPSPPAEATGANNGQGQEGRRQEVLTPAAEVAPAVSAAPRRKTIAPIRGSNALGQISARLNGISPDLLADLSEKVTRTRTSKTGKQTTYTTYDNPLHQGNGPLFRKGGAADLSEIARVLEEEGYIESGLGERDPIAASQRAEEIIKAELKSGGSTLQEGNPDAVEAEMQRRREMADDVPDDLLDPFTPDDIEESGYAAATPSVKALTEQLLAEAEKLGLDTEALREDAAKGIDEQSEDFYHARLQDSARQAIAQAREDAAQSEARGEAAGAADSGQAAGDQGEESGPGTGLTTARAGAVASGDATKHLARVMRDAGWEIAYVDLDLTGETPKADIKIERGDGRWLFAKVDAQGRASFETFQRTRRLGIDSKNPQARLAPQIDDQFLGRQKFEGARSMLRGMTNYLVDNALNPVALADMRAAWAPLLSGPASIQQETPLLASQTPADLKAKTTREADAAALDDKAQIDREADLFGLQQQTAPDQRKDSTVDMFGEPSAEDVQRAKPKGTAPTGPDLFSEPPPQAEAEKPVAESKVVDLEVAGLRDSEPTLLQKALEAGQRGTKALRDVLSGQSFLGELDDLLKLPSNARAGKQPADGIDGDAPTSESGLNGVRGDAEALRDIIKSSAFGQQGFRGVDAKTQGLVLKHVLSLSGDEQVRQVVIQLVPINMVNDLVAGQLSTGGLLNDAAVLKQALTSSLTAPVALRRDLADTLVRAIALAGAEVGSGRVAAKLVRPASDDGAASGTRNIDLGHGVDNTRNDRQTRETDTGTMLFSAADGPAPAEMRSQGIPPEAAEIHSARNTDALKAHPDYKAAKAGDVQAAERLVRDLVSPADIAAAEQKIGAGAMWVFPHAEEATGHNAIPAMLAGRYAAATNGEIGPLIVQTNRTFHTGANAMQRMIARPLFDGPVTQGARYVIVDDVSTMGGTLSELANHIQAGGGQVVGVVTLANAGRAPTIPALKKQVEIIERRYGQAVRDTFHIEPAALTRDEAGYILGFRNADDIRARAASAERERSDRLRAKGVQSSDQGLTNEGLKASVDAAAPKAETAAYAPDTDRNNLRIVDHARTAIAAGRPGFMLRAVEAPGSRSDLRAARAVARGIAGHKVIFVKQENGRVFNGAAFGSVGHDYLLIDVDSNKPVMAVVGHEMLHRLRAARPDLYDKLDARIRLVLKNESAYADALHARYAAFGLKQLSDETIHEELVADIFGDEWNDPEFWAELSKGKPAGFKAIVDAVLKFLDDMLMSITTKRPFGTDQYLDDLKAARAAVLEATREFSAGEVGSVDSVPPDLKFSPAGKTDGAAFRKWFGDSKVVDEKGEPLVVYKGMHPYDWTQERQEGRGINARVVDQGPEITSINRPGNFPAFNGNADDGVQIAGFFASDPEVANRFSRLSTSGAVFPAYLSIKHPFVIDAAGRGAGEVQFGSGGQAFRDAIRSGSYDGVIIRNTSDEGDVYVALKPEQIKSATGNNGNFDGTNPDIRFSIAGPSGPQTPPAETAFRTFQRKAQDQFNRFTVIRDWAKQQGVDLTPDSDVWAFEERMHGRIATRVEDFREKRVHPAIKAIQKAGFTMEQVGEFLHAQHAEERNKQIESIDPANKTGSGMSTADAKKILAAADPKLAALANDFRKITDETKAILLKAGIIDKDMTDAWESAYKHYVPLKGGDESPAANTGTGKGLSTAGRQKRALGHSERNEHIVENILRDHERAITLAEKNTVGHSLLAFISELANPEIATIGQPVKRKVLKNTTDYEVLDGKGMRVAIFDTLEAANKFITKHSHPGVLGFAPTPMTAHKVKGDPAVSFMSTPMLQDNEVNVYVKGHAIRVQLNDELLANAYTRSGTEGLNQLMAMNREINRYFSKVYTGYNPEFLLTNIARDFTTGLINVTGQFGAGVTAKAVANYPKAFATLLRYGATGKETPEITQYRAAGGSTGAAYLSDIERLGRDVSTAYDEYNGVIATLKGKGAVAAGRAAARKFAGHMLSWLEHINGAGESAMRLAVFEAVRDTKGYTVNDAASAAKNSTVNFNRRGEWGPVMGALYLFFNPAIQGTAAIADALFKGKHHAQAIALTGSLGVLAYILAALQYGGGDDDDETWAAIPDSVKDKNLVIRTGPKTYLTIPMAYGYGFFFGLGNAVYALQKGKDVDKVALNTAANLLEHFSPVGNPLGSGDKADVRGAVELIPGAVGGELMRNLARVAANRNSFGGEIVPDSPFDHTKPDNLRMYRSSKGTAYEKVASGLNSMTGGTKSQSGGIDVSPETLKYWARTLTGGSGGFVADSFGLAGLAARYVKNTDDPDREALMPDRREIPIARRFVKEETVQDKRRQFWDAVTEVKDALGDLDRARKLGDMEGAQSIADKRAELVGMGAATASITKMVKAKRDLIDEVMADEATSVAYKRARVKVLEKEESAIYEAYVARFAEQKREAKAVRAAIK